MCVSKISEDISVVSQTVLWFDIKSTKVSDLKTSNIVNIVSFVPIFYFIWSKNSTVQNNWIEIIILCFKTALHRLFKGVFTLGRFGSINTNSGAIALLMWFIWISVNTAIQTLVYMCVCNRGIPSAVLTPLNIL